MPLPSWWLLLLLLPPLPSRRAELVFRATGATCHRLDKDLEQGQCGRHQ